MRELVLALLDGPGGWPPAPLIGACEAAGWRVVVPGAGEEPPAVPLREPVWPWDWGRPVLALRVPDGDGPRLEGLCAGVAERWCGPGRADCLLEDPSLVGVRALPAPRGGGWWVIGAAPDPWSVAFPPAGRCRVRLSPPGTAGLVAVERPAPTGAACPQAPEGVAPDHPDLRTVGGAALAWGFAGIGPPPPPGAPDLEGRRSGRWWGAATNRHALAAIEGVIEADARALLSVWPSRATEQRLGDGLRAAVDEATRRAGRSGLAPRLRPQALALLPGADDTLWTRDPPVLGGLTAADVVALFRHAWLPPRAGLPTEPLSTLLRRGAATGALGMPGWAVQDAPAALLLACTEWDGVGTDATGRTAWLLQGLHRGLGTPDLGLVLGSPTYARLWAGCVALARGHGGTPPPGPAPSPEADLAALGLDPRRCAGLPPGRWLHELDAGPWVPDGPWSLSPPDGPPGAFLGWRWPEAVAGQWLLHAGDGGAEPEPGLSLLDDPLAPSELRLAGPDGGVVRPLVEVLGELEPSGMGVPWVADALATGARLVVPDDHLTAPMGDARHRRSGLRRLSPLGVARLRCWLGRGGALLTALVRRVLSPRTEADGELWPWLHSGFLPLGLEAPRDVLRHPRSFLLHAPVWLPGRLCTSVQGAVEQHAQDPGTAVPWDGPEAAGLIAVARGRLGRHRPAAGAPGAPVVEPEGSARDRGWVRLRPAAGPWRDLGVVLVGALEGAVADAGFAEEPARTWRETRAGRVVVVPGGGAVVFDPAAPTGPELRIPGDRLAGQWPGGVPPCLDPDCGAIVFGLWALCTHGLDLDAERAAPLLGHLRAALRRALGESGLGPPTAGQHRRADGHHRRGRR